MPDYWFIHRKTPSAFDNPSGARFFDDASTCANQAKAAVTKTIKSIFQLAPGFFEGVPRSIG